MTISDLQQANIEARLMQIFQAGLVTIVGSGWSCGHGLPSMGQLATSILENTEAHESFSTLSPAEGGVWEKLRDSLAGGVDIETALGVVQSETKLLQIVESIIGTAVSVKEVQAIDSILDDPLRSDFARFVRYLGRVGSPISVVTTNYDRLIEYASRSAGYHLDTMFAGSHLGEFDPEASQYEQILWGQERGKRTLSKRDHVRLFKPHGSLDWYETPQKKLIRTDHPTSFERRIVAPGSSKLAAGYERLFDTQRSGANQAIKEASGFFVIGFGFNDSHLQTYLLERLRFGVPALILTKELSTNALDFINEFPNVWGISEGVTPESTAITTSEFTVERANSHTWKLSNFLTEMLHSS